MTKDELLTAHAMECGTKEFTYHEEFEFVGDTKPTWAIYICMKCRHNIRVKVANEQIRPNPKETTAGSRQMGTNQVLATPKEADNLGVATVVGRRLP